jgi:carbon storage regulator CsrA
MLVLSRTTGEEIHVGQCIKIRVLKISRGRVKLGFVGSNSVRIMRGELTDQATADTEVPLSPALRGPDEGTVGTIWTGLGELSAVSPTNSGGGGTDR